MILLGLGSNLPGSWGGPAAILARAIDEIDGRGVNVVRRSSLYRSAPFGRTAQPVFVNAVVAVETHLSPQGLLARCHHVERRAGRVRRIRWGARSLDIDLLVYHEVTTPDRRSTRARQQGLHIPLSLPHPGIAERPFVLQPICEIAPRWRHPVTRLTAARMLDTLAPRHHGAILKVL